MGRLVDSDEIALQMAIELNWQQDEAKRVLKTLFAIIGAQLDARHRVSFKLFGTFSIKDDEYGIPKVIFTPTHLLKQKVGVRPDMNKYGVLLDNNKVMTAKLTGICPECQSELDSKDPPKCPKCGTRPFEEKDKR